jgi:hypothetical protein
VIKEDLEMLNAIIDKLTKNRFFEMYKELRDFYGYLATKYNFDLETHIVDPATGEILPFRDKEEFFPSGLKSRSRFRSRS